MLKKIPFHTFLLAAYFPLSLLASNLSEIEPATILRLSVFMQVLAMILLAIIFLFFRDLRRSGLIASYIIICFSVYGLLHEFFKSSSVFNPVFGRHRILSAILLVFLFLIIYFIFRKLSNLEQITFFINLFALYLVIMPIAQIGWYEYQKEKSSQSIKNPSLQVSQQLSNIENLPDIYFIVLDAYDRQDYLASEFDFDNSTFLDTLSNGGFYIAECSRSNYAHTFLSLSSTLNMEYVAEFIPPDSITEFSLKDALVHSQIRENLYNRGYQTVAFDNVHWDFSDADIFYAFDLHPFLNPNLFPSESTFIDNSILKMLKDLNPWFQERISLLAASAVKDHYLLQKFIMDSLEESIKLPSPKFVFGHIEKPHGPYVFEPNGDFIEENAFYRDKYFAAINRTYAKLGYIKQVEYINQRMIEFIELVLEDSNRDVIIVIQGDHGIQEVEDLNARLAILNAVYLPDQDYSKFYSSITPVNTFRIIQDQFFSADMGLLDDRSYYSYREDKLDYFSVDESSPLCIN